MTAESRDRLAFAPDFTVGGWLVEPGLDQVSRDGRVMRLRPQLIDMLTCLARHAGHTVSRDLLLADVWNGQFVAESGITRCIAELRQALDDCAHEPTLIQTIPKRGYRLVAPVMFVAPPVPHHAQAQVCTKAGEAPAGPAPDPLPIAASQPEPALPSASRRAVPRTLRWTLGSGAAAVLVLALTWAGVGWTKSPVHRERNTVLLADLVNSTGDPAFDSTLRLALAVHLGQAPFLRLLPDAHVRGAAARAGQPATVAIVGHVALDLCRREGAAIVLAASVARLGNRFAVGLQATDCGSGEALGGELLEVPRKEEVLSALGAAAVRMRETLGESPVSIGRHDVPIVEATTPSLDALRAVASGDAARDHARPEEALTDYRRATEFDPQFALAWARLGAAARNLGLTDESVEAFRRAYDLRGRVSEPERFYILAHYYRSVADQPEKAVEIYRTWRRVYPGATEPSANLASLAVNTFGRYADAIDDARDAVRRLPYSSLAARMLVYACLGSNRLADARQAYKDATARGIGDTAWHELGFQMAFLDGNAARMREQIEWAESRPKDGVSITRSRALAAAGAGRLGEARRLWRQAAAAAWELPAIRQAMVRLWEAEAEALLGDPQRARMAAEAAIRLHPQPATLLDAASSLALAGHTGRARALIAEAALCTEPGICARPVRLFVSQALVEAEAGRFDRARARLAEAAPFERSREAALSPLGARAIVAAKSGRPRDATAAYRQSMDLGLVLPLSPWIPFARVGLARALRDAGDTSASRAAYDTALAAMSTADLDAPLLVAARRERAALGR